MGRSNKHAARSVDMEMCNVTALGFPLTREKREICVSSTRMHISIHMMQVRSMQLRFRVRGGAFLWSACYDISDIRPLTFDRFAGAAAL